MTELGVKPTSTWLHQVSLYEPAHDVSIHKEISRRTHMFQSQEWAVVPRALSSAFSREHMACPGDALGSPFALPLILVRQLVAVSQMTNLPSAEWCDNSLLHTFPIRMLFPSAHTLPISGRPLKRASHQTSLPLQGWHVTSIFQGVRSSLRWCWRWLNLEESGWV